MIKIRLLWLVVLSIGLNLGPFAIATAGVVLPPNNQRVTDAGQLDAYVGESDVARQGTTLYAVWRDGRRTDSSIESDIFFASSNDNGASWSQNRQVSNSQYVGFTDPPAISVSPDGVIWVAWGLDACYDTDVDCGGNGSQFNDVRLARSVDGGQSWSESRIWNGTAGSISDDLNQRPQIHAENNRVYLLVHDPLFDTNGDLSGFDLALVMIDRTPTGQSSRFIWLTPEDGSARINLREGPLSTLAVQGDQVCAAWEDQRDRFSIYGRCSSDGGTSFSPAARWSTNGDDVEPKLAFAPDGSVYLSYKDQAGKDLVVRRSSNLGQSWSTPVAATQVGLNYSYSYDLAVGPDGQLVLPVAVGARSSADQSDLLVATSIDQGQSFGITGPVEQGTEEFLPISTQYDLAVVTGGSASAAQAWVVWMDDRGPATQTRNMIWSASLQLDALPPSAPSQLQASDGDSSVLLEWQASTDQNGIAYYEVYRAAAASGPYVQINPQPVTQTFYRDVGLAAGTYYYQVRAVDTTANRSAPSANVRGNATVGTTLAGLYGSLAYDRPGGQVGLRSLNLGAVGPETVLIGAFPNFSADGSQLLLVRQINNQATVVAGELDGDNLQPWYVSAQPVYQFDLPKAAGMIAAIHNDSFNGNCIPIEPRLMSLTPRVTLAQVNNINADSIAISPDRRWMAYTYRLYCDTLSSILYDSNRVCLLDTLASSQEIICQPPANYQGVDFSSTGNMLVFSANLSGQNEIWRAAISQNGELQHLTQLTRGPTGQASTSPRVSSDGNWIVFLRDTDAGPAENLQVFVVRNDGDGLRALNIAAGSVAWAGGGPAGPLVGSEIQRVYLALIGK